MKFPIFVMAFKGYRLRQVIFVAGVMFCLLPPSDTSYGELFILCEIVVLTYLKIYYELK